MPHSRKTQFPSGSEIEEALLIELDKMGGQSRPSDLYERVAQHFPSLAPRYLEEGMRSMPSTRRWNNRVQWIRQGLVSKHQIDGPSRGVWRITELGRQRLRKRR